MIEVINPSNKKELLEKWAEFESKIPDYLYADTGELKEWATPKLKDKHTHRHVSHAYAAWPSYDTQDSDELRKGIIKAMDAGRRLIKERKRQNPTGLRIRRL